MLAVVSKFAIMAAIVATLAYVPLILLAALALHLWGGSLGEWVTLGGTVHGTVGVFIGWLPFFAAACAYAAWMFPWDGKPR